MKKSLLILSAFLVAAISFPSCKKSTPTATIQVVNVTGLFSLTGNWSTLGLNSQAALQLAVTDINTYLQSKHAGFRISANVYDTKLDPATAAQDFTTATNAGTHFIIGPQSSAELAGIVPLADAAKALVISQGSTAGSLAIAGDPVFRFCPPDKVEGAAIAASIYKAGIRGLVSIARNDAGNIGLQTATDSFFIVNGGTVNALPVYSTTQAVFSSQIESLKSQLNSLSGLTSSQKGIYLASFDEGASLMAQAASDSQLSQVKWYGGDGIALSAIMLANDTADKFAIRTGFFAPSFGLPVAQQAQWQPVANRITGNNRYQCRCICAGRL